MLFRILAHHLHLSIHLLILEELISRLLQSFIFNQTPGVVALENCAGNQHIVVHFQVTLARCLELVILPEEVAVVFILIFQKRTLAVDWDFSADVDHRGLHLSGPRLTDLLTDLRVGSGRD